MLFAITTTVKQKWLSLCERAALSPCIHIQLNNTQRERCSAGRACVTVASVGGFREKKKKKAKRRDNNRKYRA